MVFSVINQSVYTYRYKNLKCDLYFFNCLCLYRKMCLSRNQLWLFKWYQLFCFDILLGLDLFLFIIPYFLLLSNFHIPVIIKQDQMCEMLNNYKFQSSCFLPSFQCWFYYLTSTSMDYFFKGNLPKIIIALWQSGSKSIYYKFMIYF